MERGRAAAVLILVLGIVLVGLGAAGVAGAGPLARTAAAQPSVAPVSSPTPVAVSPSASASPAVATAPGSATTAPPAAPSAAASGAGSPAPSTPPSAAPTPDRLAAVQALYARLVPAVRSNDVATMLALLHPATIQRYGEAGCRAYFAALNDPTFNIVVRSVAEPAPWVWDRDGRTTTISDALSVQADLTANGTTAAQEIHVAPVGGEVRWFTDCGTPI